MRLGGFISKRLAQDHNRLVLVKELLEPLNLNTAGGYLGNENNDVIQFPFIVMVNQETSYVGILCYIRSCNYYLLDIGIIFQKNY